MDKLIDDDVDNANELADHLGEVRAACTEAFREAGIPKKDRWISETRLLAQISPVLDKAGHASLPAVLNTWRYTSGVAHNLSWRWDLLPQKEVPVNQQLDLIILAPFRLTEKAWELWDRRRVA